MAYADIIGPRLNPVFRSTAPQTPVAPLFSGRSSPENLGGRPPTPRPGALRVGPVLRRLDGGLAFGLSRLDGGTTCGPCRDLAAKPILPGACAPGRIGAWRKRASPRCGEAFDFATAGLEISLI